jgi:TonB family protein
MQPYQRTREKREKTASVAGVAATLCVHALALVVLLTSGLKYLDPPPPERSSLVIEFEEDVLPAKSMTTQVGQEPQAEEIDLEREVELVQKAESPTVSDRPNVTPATRPDAHGDVEVPTPPVEEPQLDPRASFPGMSSKESDATTPHSAAEASEGFKAGQPDGNTPEGKTEGSANAHVKGRNVVGTLPKPSYATQTEGVVVVQVKVDQYGTVTEAVPGAEGTTATDKNLWAAARNAALKAHFNMDANAPAVQTGTITYIFKLK